MLDKLQVCPGRGAHLIQRALAAAFECWFVSKDQIANTPAPALKDAGPAMS
jgi:hypothetical protein